MKFKSNRLLTRLNKITNFTTEKLLFETTDNSYAARVNNKCKVSIVIAGKWNAYGNGSLDTGTATITISDNASGMREDDIETILMPYESIHLEKSINEHGVGLNCVLASFAQVDEEKGITGFNIVSKTTDGKPFQVNEINLLKDVTPNYDVNGYDFEDGHGTVIKINKISKEVKSLLVQKQSYERLVLSLGARYQKLLKDGRLEILLSLRDDKNKVLVGKDGKKYEWNVPPVEVALSDFFPIQSFPFPSAKDNKVEVVAGYAPTNEAFEELDETDKRYEQYIDKSHPYYHTKNQVDIFINDILIVQKDISWLTGTQEDSADRIFRNQKPKVQLQFRIRPDTSLSKTDIIESPELEKVKEEIKSKLIEVGYLNPQAKYPQKEKKAKDVLEKVFTKIADTGTLQRENPLSDCGLVPDFEYERTENGEKIRYIIEVKIGQIGSEQVSQLVGYMAAKGTNNNRQNIKGKIIGRNIAETAKNFIQKLKNESFDITFESLDEYNI